MYDQPGNGGPDHREPDGARAGFVLLGILAALGLVVVAGLFIGFEVQQHGFQEKAQSNKAAATTRAAADAEAFYRDLLAATRTVSPTQSREIHALGLRHAVLAGPPVVRHGSIVVAFRAEQGFAEPGLLGGSQDTVLLCYTATVPIAPATTPAATLSRTACPAGLS